MNSTSKKLTQSDLIRNYILMDLEPHIKNEGKIPNINNIYKKFKTINHWIHRSRKI